MRGAQHQRSIAADNARKSGEITCVEETHERVIRPIGSLGIRDAMSLSNVTVTDTAVTCGNIAGVTDSLCQLSE
jgi:hypothetical protein